jgi:3-hydroxyisobutyrate dehydrogenase-like beta-hydroxyacid dehydrogenase
MDSVVSGSVSSVLVADLVVIASSQTSNLEDATDVFDAFAKRVIYLGYVGAGKSMQFAVNLIVYILNSVVAEGLLLAVRSGIQSETAYEMFQNSATAAPLIDYKKMVFLDQNSPLSMNLDLVLKNLDLIVI